MFGRRGPAQAKFTPMELRELDHSPNIEVIVDPEDIDYDEGSIADRGAATSRPTWSPTTLENWAIRDVGDRPHKLFLHFFESPVEVLGEDGKVVGLRTERTALDGTGNVKGTGEFNDWDVQAVYRAVGYLLRHARRAALRRSTRARSRTTAAGSSDADGEHLPRRLRHRLDQARPGRPDRPHQGRRERDRRQPARRLAERPAADARLRPSPEAVGRVPRPSGTSASPPGRAGTGSTPHEKALGEPQGRERIKVVEREDMLRESGAQA